MRLLSWWAVMCLGWHAGVQQKGLACSWCALQGMQRRSLLPCTALHSAGLLSTGLTVACPRPHLARDLWVNSEGASGQRGSQGRHRFGWRDAMDIVVKWRQLAEPNDQVGGARGS